MSTITKTGIPGGGRWELVEDGKGMGGFLDPPGALSHTHSVVEWRGSRSQEPEGFMSLESALREDYVPEAIKAAIRALPETKECAEDWLERVYGYFARCYSPDGENRNVSDCIIIKRDDPDPPPINHHLAVMWVRRHFPDHEPRTDLIASEAAS